MRPHSLKSGIVVPRLAYILYRGYSTVLLYISEVENIYIS